MPQRKRSRGFVAVSVVLSIACLFVTARAFTAGSKVKTACVTVGNL